MKKILMMLFLALIVGACSKEDTTTTNPSTEPQTFIITFDANGGEGSMYNQSVKEGKSIELTPNYFTREDYAFDGWNTKADGTGVSYENRAKIQISSNTTLYAKWIDEDAAIPVTGVSFVLDAVTLKCDEFFDPLEVVVTPANATNKEVVWSSSNDEVVYVDNTSGDMMTPGGLGTETITVTTKDGGFTATCKVTVKNIFSFDKNAGVFISGTSEYTGNRTFTSGPYEGMLCVGNKTNGQKFNYAKTKWSTSNAEVVSLDETLGSEIGFDVRKNGAATITAEDEAGGKLNFIITVQKFEFAPDAGILIFGSAQYTDHRTFTYGPYEGNLCVVHKDTRVQFDYPKTFWHSSDPSVVKLDAVSGSKIGFSALKNGTATITAYDDCNNKLSLIITVENR